MCQIQTSSYTENQTNICHKSPPYIVVLQGVLHFVCMLTRREGIAKVLGIQLTLTRSLVHFAGSLSSMLNRGFCGQGTEPALKSVKCHFTDKFTCGVREHSKSQNSFVSSKLGSYQSILTTLNCSCSELYGKYSRGKQGHSYSSHK